MLLCTQEKIMKNRELLNFRKDLQLYYQEKLLIRIILP
ncbi:MAG: hypothetical protein JWO78_559 [Micavibrio sp.]|nr:hypothetical protein [Micavibrio sp.]